MGILHESLFDAMTVLPLKFYYFVLYNNQINARALIGQSPMGYWENRASSELLYKSTRAQVSMGFRLTNHLGCW